MGQINHGDRAGKDGYALFLARVLGIDCLPWLTGEKSSNRPA